MHYSPIQPRHIEQKSNKKVSPVVVITKTINAPLTAVFHAWKDVDMIKQWWGPEGSTCSYARMDFHVGEKYLIGLQDVDGNENWTTGVYAEIDPYRSLVFSNFTANAKGDITNAKLSLCHEGLPSNMKERVFQDWSSSLDKLKELVEQQH